MRSLNNSPLLNGFAFQVAWREDFVDNFPAIAQYRWVATTENDADNFYDASDYSVSDIEQGVIIEVIALLVPALVRLARLRGMRPGKLLSLTRGGIQTVIG
jgi:hypothetical protein